MLIAIKPDEALVVALHRGAGVVRCLGPDGDRVVVAIGRNKQARVPTDRVLLATGLIGLTDAELEALSLQAIEVSGAISLREVWELVAESGEPVTLVELAELYFGSAVGPERMAGLAIHLETEPVYFARSGRTYVARHSEDIEREARRRQKEEERQAAEAAVIDALAVGRLPESMGPAERGLLAQIRGFVLDGDDHPRSRATKTMLGRIIGGSGDLQRAAFDLLVAAGEIDLDHPMEIERAGLSSSFAPEVEAEAGEIAASPVAAHGAVRDRRDLTGLPAFTIDDPNTLDRDDALSAGAMDEGLWRFGVHIADAGALIPVGGPVDVEADRRMSTLYTPDMKVPMVPTALSEGAGSILPGFDRPALSLLVTLSDGAVVDWELVPSVVRSVDALTYDGVDAELREGGGDRLATLRTLDSAATSLRLKREAAGALVLERPEMSITVSDLAPGPAHGGRRVSVRVVPRTTPGRRLVTEMMILFNVMLARFCVENAIPAAYRTQPVFDPGPMSEGASHDDPVAQYRLMGRISPAEISTEPGRHHGLGVDAYVQATSPLRRYPDLVMQRQVSHFLATGSPLYDAEQMASVAHRAEVQLRELAAIENQRRRYWFLRFLEQGVDEGLTDYEAVVLDTERRGPPLLELIDYPFRVRAELPSTASSSDVFTLRLHDVDLWRRVPHFFVA